MNVFILIANGAINLQYCLYVISNHGRFFTRLSPLVSSLGMLECVGISGVEHKLGHLCDVCAESYDCF